MSSLTLKLASVLDLPTNTLNALYAIVNSSIMMEPTVKIAQLIVMPVPAPAANV